MPTTTLEKNYSKCPLKKRPVNYIFDENEIKDEPENLCIKKESLYCSDKLSVKMLAPAVSLCIKSEDSYALESDDEKFSPAVVIPTPTYPKFNLQPWGFHHLPSYATDFYKKLSQSSPAAYYHPTALHHHLQHQHMQPFAQTSPLRGDLHSPSSPSESSLSPPPPHYIHGRGGSISPPIREMYAASLGGGSNYRSNLSNSNSSLTSRHNSHIIKPEIVPTHRFMPYQIPYQPYAPTLGLTANSYNSSHTQNLNQHQHQPEQMYQHQQQQHRPQVQLQLPPISPSYSEISSKRSPTPESYCSIPEDLSLKQSSPKHSLSLHSASSSSLTPASSLSSLSTPLLSSPSSSLSLSSLSSISTVPSMPIVSSFANHDNRDFNASLSSSLPTASSTLSSNATKRLCETNSNCSSSSSSSISTSSSNSSKENKQSPPRYQCPDCNKSYSTFSGLTKHQQFHCPAAEGNQVKKSFSCKDCDKTYVSLGALKMHIRTHTLPCKCNICGKAFSRPWLLQGHIRTHTGEKPFSCQHCHRAFADRSNLRAHLQTHSDIKKYSCTTCSKTFSRMSLLTKHNEGGCPGIHPGSASPTYMPQYPEH